MGKEGGARTSDPGRVDSDEMRLTVVRRVVCVELYQLYCKAFALVVAQFYDG